MCHTQGPQCSDAGEAGTHVSSPLPLSHCAPLHIEEILYFYASILTMSEVLYKHKAPGLSVQKDTASVNAIKQTCLNIILAIYPIPKKFILLTPLQQ